MLQDKVCRFIKADFFESHQILFPDAEQHLQIGRNVTCGMLEEHAKLDHMNVKPLEWNGIASKRLSELRDVAERLLKREPCTPP